MLLRSASGPESTDMAITLSASDIPNAPLSARLTTPQIWGIVMVAPYMLVFAAVGLGMARHKIAVARSAEEQPAAAPDTGEKAAIDKPANKDAN